MAITWLVPEEPKIASYRYRCEIPRRYIEDKYEVTVVAKDWIHLDELRGKFIWDCCDDHFGNHKRDYYLAISDLASAIVVPTQGMKERVKEETGREAFIVEDPYEFPLVYPRVSRPDRLFWYGHKSNLKGLLEHKEELDGRQIRVMSNWPGCIPWSHEGMLQSFAWCDAVVIPVPEDSKSQAKSPNRMVEAIRQGKYVIANPLPSYSPYGMWQGSLKEGLEWMEAHPEEAMDAVVKAQSIVEEKHAPWVIAKQWEEVFRVVEQL